MGREEVLWGSTKKIRTGCGSLYITLNTDGKGNLVEVFVRLGKAGGCASSQTESLGRLITLGLRNGASVSEIIKQLIGIGCHQPIFSGMGNRVLSCADAVAQSLRAIQNNNGSIPLNEELIKEEGRIEEEVTYQVSMNPCPECGASLIMEEGCEKCLCGYTKC